MLELKTLDRVVSSKVDASPSALDLQPVNCPDEQEDLHYQKDNWKEQKIWMLDPSKSTDVKISFIYCIFSVYSHVF